MKLFEGRTAMVTGAGKNIGREIALSFAKAGANVIVCDYNAQNAEETVKEIALSFAKNGANMVVCDYNEVAALCIFSEATLSI